MTIRWYAYLSDNKVDNRKIYHRASYQLVCKRCGLVDFFSLEEPNISVPKCEDSYVSRTCDFCGYKMFSYHKPTEIFEREFQRQTGEIPEECEVRPLIEADYIINHSNEFDEALYHKRLDYEERIRIENEEYESKLHCPKCRSTSIITQKQGFGIGKAAAGVLLTGNLLAAAAGGINANKNWNVCQKCGHKWKI